MGVPDWINFALNIDTVSVTFADRRTLVFDSRETLKIIEPLKESDPLPVFAMARAVEWRFNALGITPALFPEFRDKEFVQETLDQVERIEKGTYGRMTPEQQKQAEDCAVALHEMPLLDKAIASATAREYFAATDGERSALSTRRALLTFGAIMAFLATCPICALSGQFGPYGIVIGLAVGLAVAVGGVIMFLMGRSSPALKALDQHRASLQAEFADDNTQQLIEERLGKKNAQGYLALRDERQALIQNTFSSLADDRLLMT